MASTFEKIQHVVVVMLENRSFDNLLGFLYAQDNNRPPRNLPAQEPPTYAGLMPPRTTDAFWNPSNSSFFSDNAPPVKVFASSPTTGDAPFQVPNPDPNELFAEITFQLFGPNSPLEGVAPEMLGFVVDYQTAKGSNADSADRIMQSYSPEQLPVLSQLAKNFAVSDEWFASVPAQTWPNRGFMHTGTSRGEVANGNVVAYDTETIFEVLQRVGASWAVYNHSVLPALTQLQYPRLLEFPTHFRSFTKFKSEALGGTLPSYSFVEPSFVFQPDDQHPPHDVALGEQFLWDVWTAVSTGPRWKETLLVITYDEHGGCYDHIPPPWGAAIPDAASEHGQQGFRFNRFGVRVPAVVISPYIEAGTVFRSPSTVPCDHTSLLATLRDWLHIPGAVMLPSLRVAAAPTLEFLLTRDEARTDLPVIARPPRPMFALATNLVEGTMPLNDLQLSMLVALESDRLKRALVPTEIKQLQMRVPTKAHLATYFQSVGRLTPSHEGE